MRELRNVVQETDCGRESRNVLQETDCGRELMNMATPKGG